MSLARVGIAGALGLGLLIARAPLALGDSQGACSVALSQVPGAAWDGSGVWHVRGAGALTVAVVTVEPKPNVKTSIEFYGVAVPAVTSVGADGGAVINLDGASTYGVFTKTMDVAVGTSACSVTVPIVVDDRAALGSIATLVGLVLFGFGILGVLSTSIRRRGFGKRLGGGFFGLLGGLGAGLLLQEFGWVDPADSLLLAAPLAGLLVGAAFPTILPRREVEAPAPPVEAT